MQLLLREGAHLGVPGARELLGLIQFRGHVLVLAEPLDRGLDLRERTCVLAVLGRIALHRGLAEQARQLRVAVFDGCELVQHE